MIHLILFFDIFKIVLAEVGGGARTLPNTAKISAKWSILNGFHGNAAEDELSAKFQVNLVVSSDAGSEISIRRTPGGGLHIDR